MCNGHSTRVTQGGSIAVLRPTSHLVRAPSEDEMLLVFSNHFGNAGTSIELQGLDDHHFQRHRHWIVIHRDGDLDAPSQSVPINSLHSFALDSALETTMQLPQRLDLSVGDVGIIGRRISVMTESTQGPLTVAEGVIGWN